MKSLFLLQLICIKILAADDNTKCNDSCDAKCVMSVQYIFEIRKIETLEMLDFWTVCCVNFYEDKNGRCVGTVRDNKEALENTDKGNWREVSMFLIGSVATLAVIGLLGFVRSRFHKREALFRDNNQSTGGNQEVYFEVEQEETDDNYNGLVSPPIYNNTFQSEEHGNSTSPNPDYEDYEFNSTKLTQ